MKQMILSAVLLFMAGAAPGAEGADGQDEIESLGHQVAACWNMGALDAAARSESVTVAFGLSRDGTLIADTLRPVHGEKALSDAEAALYESARRAIIRCGARGFDLPPERHDEWKTVEMTFTPEK